MESPHPRVVHVRQGRIAPVGSWIYVWVDTADGTIAHVGGTGFDPELRAFLHLTSDDPDLGRIRAHVPQWDTRNFDVLAFELPENLPRSEAKRALGERLERNAHSTATTDLRDDGAVAAIDVIATVIERHSAALRAGKSHLP